MSSLNMETEVVDGLRVCREFDKPWVFSSTNKQLRSEMPTLQRNKLTPEMFTIWTTLLHLQWSLTCRQDACTCCYNVHQP